LIERDSIKLKRVAYLPAVKKYREGGRPTIYGDETLIHNRHIRPDDTPSGYMSCVTKGRRLIIVHTGDRTGFIPGAVLTFKSHFKTGDITAK
jgi:hypothetical protein